VALRRVLIVDDSPAIRETVSVILARDYDVEAVAAADFRGPEAAHPRRADLLIIGAGDSATLAGTPHPPPDVPVLWLLPERLSPPVGIDIPRGRALTRSFVPHELRACVRQLLSGAVEPVLAGSVALQGRSRVEPPYLSPEAADVARAAVGTRLPVLVWGGPGTGRSTLARTIHVLSGGGSFIAIDAPTFAARPITAHDAAPGTLFIDRVEQLDAEGQQRLLASLEPNGTVATGSGPSLRLIAGAERDLEEALGQNGFSSELFYRIMVLAIRLVPLRERPHDIPDLVRLISAQLAQSLGLPAVSFSPGALQRLANYLWFGDLIELEAVLARTIVLARKEVIDADDLLFEAARPSPVSAPVSGPQSPPARLEREAAGQTLELVINELAHELKNPMVTIKTFAQHLRRLVYNGEEEEQVARLTGEAVDQIDQVLENLLQFTRFDAPTREPVALPAVLGPAVAALAQVLKPRSRRVDYRPPPPVTVLVDRTQITYALTNLLRGLARGLGETGRIIVGHEDPASVQIELPSGFDPSDGRLFTFLTGTDEARPPLPLPTVIAKSIIERNGGALAFRPDGHPPTVTVHLPVADQEEIVLASDGKASRPHRR